MKKRVYYRCLINSVFGQLECYFRRCMMHIILSVSCLYTGLYSKKRRFLNVCLIIKKLHAGFTKRELSSPVEMIKGLSINYVRT